MRDSKIGSPRLHATRYDGRVMEAVSSLAVMLTDAGIATRVSVPHTPLPISSEAESVLTETAIEAVTNIIKHAPNSKSASIDVYAGLGVVQLVVKNVAPSPPTGTEPTAGGRGLNRARQRLTQRGGNLESNRTSDGWILHATAPANENEAG